MSAPRQQLKPNFKSLIIKYCDSSRLRTQPFRDCNGVVLLHGVCMYIRAKCVPKEKRKALARPTLRITSEGRPIFGPGITEKQIKGHAASAERLEGFLRRVLTNEHIVVGNNTDRVLRCVMALHDIAPWLRNLQPSRPSLNDVALALSLHLKQKAGDENVTALAYLLKDAFLWSELPCSITRGALSNKIKRGNLPEADRLLATWNFFGATQNLHTILHAQTGTLTMPTPSPVARTP